MSDEREPMRKCVVTWAYYDGSAHGVVGVYHYESTAKAVCEYLDSLGTSRRYRINVIDTQPEMSK